MLQLCWRTLVSCSNAQLRDSSLLFNKHLPLLQRAANLQMHALKPSNMMGHLDVVLCSDVRREKGCCLGLVDFEKLAFPPFFREECMGKCLVASSVKSWRNRYNSVWRWRSCCIEGRHTGT